MDLIRLATNALTEQESTFTKEDILKVAGILSVGEQKISNLERAFSELTKDKEIKLIGQDKEGKDIYTTKEMQKIENNIVKIAKDGQSKVKEILIKEKTEKVIREKYSHLTNDQKKAVTHILTSKDTVTGIQGDAGTGKTTMLNAVREQLEGQGYTVKGLSFTGKAASELESGSGIESQTIHSFLNKKEHGGDTGKTFNFNYNENALNKNKSILTVNTLKNLRNELSGKKPHDPKPYRDYENDRWNTLQKMNKDIEGVANKIADKIKGNKTVYVIDEASMVGSKQMDELLRYTKENNIRVVMVGDIKQMQSISAGCMFEKLQEGAMKTVEIKDVVRQKDENYKAIVSDISNKKIDHAFEKMEAGNNIHEIKDRQARKEAIINDYCSKKDYKDTLIVTALNKDRNEFNEAIRSELKEQGKLKGNDYNFTVRESKGLQPTSKHFSQSYKEGDVLLTHKAGVMGRAGSEGRVVEVNQDNHTIQVQDKDNKLHTIDLKKDGDKLSTYQEKEQSFCKGEKIVFLKNDKRLSVQNGMTGTIKSIDKNGYMIVTADSGKEVSFNMGQYNYIDHGYAVTDYKSQGQTSKEVIFNVDTEKGTQHNSFYVAATRGKDKLHIYTDNKEKLKEQVKESQEKTSTLDHKGHKETTKEDKGHTDKQAGKDTEEGGRISKVGKAAKDIVKSAYTSAKNKIKKSIDEPSQGVANAVVKSGEFMERSFEHVYLDKEARAEKERERIYEKADDETKAKMDEAKEKAGKEKEIER